jgi:hypothetical protein
MSPTLIVVATISKSRSASLRVAVSRWPDRTAIEIQECSATVPGQFWPTASKVTLDVALLPELVAALQAAARELLHEPP